MTSAVVIVDEPDDWQHQFPGLRVLGAREYFRGELEVGAREPVVNLCRLQGYQETGYYVSLLAEARGQQVLPSVRISLELQTRPSHRPHNGLPAPARKRLQELGGDGHTLDVMFGETADAAFAELGRELFERFPAPVLRVELRPDDPTNWRIVSISPRSLARLEPERRELVGPALERWLVRRRRVAKPRPRPRQRLAILRDLDEAMPPSNRRAIKRFCEAAETRGIAAESITRHDRDRLAEFDALFIRVTTGVDHYSYEMACQAEREGLVVIDDPQSIIRCSNKVYLAELMARHGLPTPTTLIVGPGELDRAEQLCGYPLVLKVPDGSFSRGVFKVADRAELEAKTAEMFAGSELIIAQAYTYTEFDWRVGVLANEPLFASKYHMAKRHWQVYKYGAAGSRYGSSENLPLLEVPEIVLETALAASRQIGDGLYGVDLKQTADGEVLVIEVNDNPNIDSPYEDRELGGELYLRIVDEFGRRLRAL